MPDSPILADLNPPQREAVTTRGGPLMILAGAGSGKTRALSRRLAHLIDTGDAWPNEILAVTFTNKAAREMRERVAELLGEEKVQGLWIGTFHSMGARILRMHAGTLGFERDFTILDAGDQERLIKRLHADADFKHKYWTAKRMVNTFSRWKDDGLLPKDLSLDDVGFQNARVLEFYQEYETALKRQGCMDFGDLLLKCLELWMAEPQILEGFQNRFRHILVDEYQDTNAVQYRWLKFLAHKHGNLCVVGDDDQSIYGWRGARLDNILKFEKDFPGTKVVRLEQNYRSTATILKAAGDLIGHNAGRMGKTLWTDGADGEKIVQYTAQDGDDEARFVAREIEKLCGGNGFDRAAVLVRTASLTNLFERQFSQSGIPYQVVGGLRFLDRAEVRDALAYLRLTVSNRDDIAFTRVVNTPKRGMGPKALATLSALGAERGLPLLEAAAAAVNDGVIKGATGGKLAAFLELIGQGRKKIEAGEPPDAVMNFLLKKSGYLQSIETDERAEDKKANLVELETSLSAYDDAIRFLEDAALVTDMGEATDQSAIPRVVISTLHAAKGLEFPYVFLVGLEEGLLPHRLAVDEAGEQGLEEERRLTYVGMTRARERLFMTRAKRRRLFRGFEATLPSRFLREIPEEAVETRGTSLSVKRGVSGGDWMAQADAMSRSPSPKPPSTFEDEVKAVEKAASQQGKKKKPPASGIDWMAAAASMSDQVKEAREAEAQPPEEVRILPTRVVKGNGPWPLNSRVMHKKFGEGIVRGYEGEGEKVKIIVYFTRYGGKTLYLRYAGLEPA